MKKVLFITQKRKDAIGIVDSEIKKKLKENKKIFFDLFEIKEKGIGKKQIFFNYCKNIFLILKKGLGYKRIFFSWENPYGIFLKICYPRKKIIINVHHVENYWGKSIIGKIILKTTDCFFAISNFTKQQLIDLGVPPEKIIVNYNGISENYYPEYLSNFLPFQYILYVGTEIPRKNLETLLKAFYIIHKKYPDIKFIKIGKAGDIKSQNNFDSLVSKLGLKNSVIVKRNFIPEKELRKYYSNALCYVSMSKLEGFGLTIPEAMACGCPIVASNIGPFKEICGKTQILINPFDIESVVLAIEKYKTNVAFREVQKEKGMERAKEFTWEQNKENLVLFFQDY